MIDYTVLEIWYSPKMIQYAIKLARDSVSCSRLKESYFPDDSQDFMPHTWVVDAICSALEEEYRG